MTNTIREAKQNLPLPELMKRLGLGEHAKKSAHCPFHDDKHNSFSAWQQNGVWRWKCHASCGFGDEITFLELHENLSRGDAITRFLELAGVGDGDSCRQPAAGSLAQKRTVTFDWDSCVNAFTDKDLEWLAKWRGYSVDFCRSLRNRRLIGIWKGCVAFPVHGEDGIVVGAHYRSKSGNRWFYTEGCAVRPLVIGASTRAGHVHIFESYWDAFAVMDKFEGDELDLVIITRGAGNGSLVGSHIPGGATYVFAWKQNDTEKNGKRAADEWLNMAMRAAPNVRWVKTPEQFKDPNDWTRAGATFDDLIAAMVKAKVIREAAMGKSESIQLPDVTQAKPFPLHCLPTTCEAMARAVSETLRVLQSLPGCCALGILSAAIGKGLQVRSGTNRATRGNLYILGSAESGSGKSETFRHLAKPFFECETEHVEVWKTQTKAALLSEAKVLEGEIAKLTKLAAKAENAEQREEARVELQKKIAAHQDVVAKMRGPAFQCEDVTGEKLAVLLAQNAEQIASLSADAVAIVNILLGRYNKLDRTDEGIYLKAFSGDRCKVDRQTRDSIVLESPCLTALWLTQPDKLESLLAERSLSDGGLIPRLLVCHTHCEAQEIPREVVPEIPAVVENAYRDLVRDLIETYRLADEPFTIEPTAEALETMNAHYNAIVKRRRSDLHDVTIYAARWNEQAWRIAVVLHAAKHGAHAHEHRLELDTAKRAIELADWFAAQQLEILSGCREKARRDKWDAVIALADEKPRGIRGSDVYRRRITRNADEAHTLLAEMEAAGELSGCDEKPESGGHVTRIYTRAKK